MGSGRALLNSTALLTAVGMLDDSREIRKDSGFWTFIRLILYATAAIAIVAALPSEIRIIPKVPMVLERCCLILVVVGFINFVNFMDGMDWMTLVEVLPIGTAIIILFWLGLVPSDLALVAAALTGAMIGFVPFNKPVAKLFLGDAGSLPIGLILAWLILRIAAEGYHVAAFLLPLYYLAETVITLAWRIWRRERFWEARRKHFYQIAKMSGASVLQVVGIVFLLNLVLASLAVLTIKYDDWRVNAGALLAGALGVILVLTFFNRKQEALRVITSR